MIGVVYKFQPSHKLNGSLFYSFEHAAFLKSKLYLVDISDRDLKMVIDILSAKYSVPVDNLVPLRVTDLYFLKLDKTLVLDIRSFYHCKEFLTNEIHVNSNESHEMYRYKDNRTVTYYGSYDYQDFDIFNYSKINFSIFKELEKSGDSVFVSGMFIRDGYQYSDPNKTVITKSHDRGFGNLFELIDTVHYIHGELDTNNRIIPEALYYNKKVTIEDNIPHIVDSTSLRYKDIIANGLGNYTLSNNDEIIKACLKLNN